MDETTVPSVPPQSLESTPAEPATKEVSDAVAEQETNVDNPVPTATIYTQASVVGGAFLGGPMAVGYIIARNFKAFNESKKAWLTGIVTICASAAIFSLAIISDTTWRGFPVVYTVIAYVLIRHYQGAKIDAHIKAGGPTYGYLNIIGVSIAALIMTAIPLVVIAVVVVGPDETETQQSFSHRDLESPAVKEYQALKHQIYFLQSNISAEEVDKLAAGLTKTGFFNEESRRQIYVRKVNDTYEVSIPCKPEITTDPDAYKEFISFRNSLQQWFPGKIILNLVVERFDNVVKRIE